MMRWLAAGLTAAVLAAAPSATPRFDAEGYRLAVPPRTFEFPRDHASHPGFRTEWWYWTGHLASGTRTFGYELTFFRVALAPPRPPVPGASEWRASDAVFAHLAVTDDARARFHTDEKAARAAAGLAGADSARERVWVDDWRAELAPDGRTHRLRAGGGGVALDLALAPSRPPVVHGAGGVSQKTAGVGNASHYYSITRLATRGMLVLADDTLAVTGDSWMDHEFGSGGMGGRLQGWDWFAVQLDDGRELMLYQLRRRDGSREPHSSGTLVRGATSRTLAAGEYSVTPLGTWESPAGGTRYPSGWRLDVPGDSLSLVLEPTVRGQELIARAMGGVAYWEGRCRVRGTAGGLPVRGNAYAELTGYGGASPFAPGAVGR